jgi:hypothetical protein
VVDDTDDLAVHVMVGQRGEDFPFEQFRARRGR